MNSNDDWNIFADYRRFRQNPVRFVRDFYNMMSGADFAAFDDYIGCRIYENSNWYDTIKQQTYKQPELIKCIDSLVSKQIEREKQLGLLKRETDVLEREKVCRKQIQYILDNIAAKALPSFSRVSGPRFSYFFVSQTLPRGYTQGMHISRYQVRRLREKAKELEAKKQSLVLFPCHKSHCDYIALVYLFFRIGVTLPSTIAGDNLDIPLVSWFLRQVGATFIRRGSWKDDPLYTAFFQSLVNSYLQQGMNIQCFIEGTRSRTGKLLPPKYGILKFIMEAITSGAAEDCWIVPVSTQYDKAMEADAYATELMGREKKSENLKSFLDSRSLFKMNLGRIDIRIGEGFSLKQFVTEHMQQNAPKPVILRTLAYKVLNDINGISVVMPSALVGTVLLTTRQRGLSKEDLLLRVCTLIDRIVKRGGHVGTILKPESELTNQEVAAMVDTAVEVLGSDLVTVETKQLLEPVYYAKDVFKLSYYRNQVVHLFVAEALVCVCLYQHYTSRLTLQVPLKDLRPTLLFLSKMLSGEFVFKNEENLVRNLCDTLLVLQEQKIILKFDEEFVYINPQEISDDWAFTHFYTYLVWPFIDGYWSVSVTLQMTPTNTPIKLKQFFTVAQQVANTLYTEGALSHIEACNRQVVMSAVSHAEARGLVKLSKNSIEVIAPSSTISKLCDKLSLFRNEFMRRPAGSHLVTRVEQLGKGLIQAARI